MEQPTTLFGAVFALVIFIAILLIAKNVSILRKAATGEYQDAAYWQAIYEKHAAWGNKAEALQALQEAIWAEYKKSGFSEKTYKTLINTWEPTVKELGGSFMAKQQQAHILG